MSKWSHLIVSSEGALPSDPCAGAVCTSQHVSQWVSPARALAASVDYQLNQLRTMSNDRGMAIDPLLAAKVGTFQAQMQAISPASEDALPSVHRAVIDNTISSMREGVKVLERLDRAIANLGVPVPVVPGLTPVYKKENAVMALLKDNWKPIVAGAVFIGLGTMIYRRRAGSSYEEEELGFDEFEPQPLGPKAKPKADITPSSKESESEDKEEES